MSVGRVTNRRLLDELEKEKSQLKAEVEVMEELRLQDGYVLENDVFFVFEKSI